MTLWRREPLHERLAREAGLEADQPAPHDPGPHWGEVGIHGVHRPRAWDAVVTVDAPDLRGERAVFVILPDSSLLIEDYAFDDDLTPLADAIEAAAGSPLRAEAVRRDGTLFSVGGRRLHVAELPEEIEADELELTIAPNGERVLLGDGKRIVPLPSLERLVALGWGNVIRARRLDGQLWEVEFASV
jgi:hypothetical protein